MDVLSEIKIYTSDSIWQQIFTDLGAVVLSAPNNTDINFDELEFEPPISILELKTLILNALDYSDILYKVFNKKVKLSRQQSQIVAFLYKNNGASVDELKMLLGYSSDAMTHSVDTAIYQLRRLFGADFIKNKDGVYYIGTV